MVSPFICNVALITQVPVTRSVPSHEEWALITAQERLGNCHISLHEITLLIALLSIALGVDNILPRYLLLSALHGLLVQHSCVVTNADKQLPLLLRL